MKIHDTCGVHNLHGMPGVFGALISCIVVSMASVEIYGNSLKDIMPYVGKTLKDSSGNEYEYTASHQAINQLLALIVTIAIALVG